MTIFLYVAFSLIFALITYKMVRTILKNQKLNKNKVRISREEKQKIAIEKKANRSEEKRLLREAMAQKKAEWKAEDAAADAEAKQNIIEIKKQTEEATHKQIAKILFSYFSEIKDLNQNFNVTLDKQEMPFTEEDVKAFNVYSEFEKAYYSGSFNENKTVNHDIINDKNTILN